MFINKVHFKIAVVFITAILVFKANAKQNPLALDQIKAKVAEMLLLGKKPEALTFLSEQQNINGANKQELTQTQLAVALKFLSQEAQEKFERALLFSVENPKEAGKQSQACLDLDPVQLDCLIQKYRSDYRQNNKTDLTRLNTEIKKIASKSYLDNWSTLFLLRKKEEFKTKVIFKNIFNLKEDEAFLLVSLELERAFAAKNYSRAKESIGFFEKNYSDWPDLIYYKSKLNLESAEQKESDKEFVEQGVIYANKCKNLSKSTARKYRYDFDLCLRSFEK